MHAAGRLPGNPASVHQFGQASRREVEGALAHVAQLVGMADGRVVLTGSAWEAHCIALGALASGATSGPLLWLGQGARAARAAALAEACGLTGLHEHEDESAPARAGADGMPTLVVGAADPITGELAPVRQLALYAQARGLPWALSWAAAAPLAASLSPGLRPTAVILEAAPLGGPAPMAALVLAPGVSAPGLWAAGGQQAGSRPGTVPRDLAAGLGVAAAWACAHPHAYASLATLRDALDAWVQRLPEVRVAARAAPRLPHMTCWQVPAPMLTPLRRHLRRAGLPAQLAYGASGAPLLALALGGHNAHLAAACAAAAPPPGLVADAALCAQGGP